MLGNLGTRDWSRLPASPAGRHTRHPPRLPGREARRASPRTLSPRNRFAETQRHRHPRKYRELPRRLANRIHSCPVTRLHRDRSVRGTLYTIVWRRLLHGHALVQIAVDSPAHGSFGCRINVVAVRIHATQPKHLPPRQTRSLALSVPGRSLRLQNLDHDQRDVEPLNNTNRVLGRANRSARRSSPNLSSGPKRSTTSAVEGPCAGCCAEK